MNHGRKQRYLAAFALSVCGAGGCDAGDEGAQTSLPGALTGAPSDETAPVDEDTDEPEGTEDTEDKGLTRAQVHAYLARTAPFIAGRSLRFEENELIEERGEAAIDILIDRWMTEPGFAEAIREIVQQQLAVSGARDGVDFELPGNLAAEIAREDLPWSTILTADYCVDAYGQHIPCDTGAPYEAGVLATRAYLIANKGRFNLGRAKRMLETFACRIYPMEQDIQIPLEKERLIPMFQAVTAEEQTVEEAKAGFGNGTGCYSCHSQFGAHAQLYVKFDDLGVWRSEATGLQDPEAELGRSFDGLYTSHMYLPEAAQSEASQMFGEPVENLRHAAEVLADSPLFYACSVKNFIAKAFGLRAGHSQDVNHALIESLSEEIRAIDAHPTIREFIRTIFTDRRVVEAAVATLEGE